MHATSKPRRVPRMLLAMTLVAAAFGACQGAASPTSAPSTVPPVPPTALPTVAPAATTAARATPAALGIITLTDDDCSWAGNPGKINPGRMIIRAWNHTDDYTSFFVHRLHVGRTWAEGEAAIAEIQEALVTGADWPPEVSDVVTEGDAAAGFMSRLDFDATPGTYGVVCSASTSPTGDILTVFLAGPLVVGP